MAKFELYVADPSIPYVVGLKALLIARDIIHRAEASPARCCAAFFARAIVWDEYITTAPDPEAPDEAFHRFVGEHHPGVDMDEVERLAVAWEEAMTTAGRIVLEENPGYDLDDCVLSLRPVPADRRD